uniref:PLAC domain-containing protein n=1 Tax=Anolis carolinensis TaxID=28377 RepID=A0A803TXU2_ANOCA
MTMGNFSHKERTMKAWSSRTKTFSPVIPALKKKIWDWKHREEEERFCFQVRQVYHTNGAGDDEELGTSRDPDLDLKLNHITISTAMPHGTARPERQETSRIGLSRLRLFRKLCLQDLQNAAICRELHYLAIKLGRKNSTAVFWGEPLVELPEGLRKQPTRKKILQHVNSEVFAVDETTNDTVMASSSKPSSTFHLGFVNKHLSEALQAPGSERWETSRWSECSRTCSEGFQYRTVRCWKMLAPGFDSSVYDDMCESIELTRPMERKPCKNKPCGPQWELSEWSECSARCGGPGTMKREVRCSVEANLCNDSVRPISQRECSGPPCDRHWTVSDWGSCSGLCGEGRMSRFVTCRNLEGKVISDSQCNPKTKPLAIYPCGDKNCPAHWVEQEWDQCNATCGRGVKRRTVLCVGLENGLYREYAEEHCDAFPKPDMQASCFKRPCSTWFSTSWSQCSKTCGTGLRFREVKCYQGETLGQGCESASKPEAKQTCQLQLCPTDAPDEDCEDKATANCVLVLKVKLCSHWYYRKACCRSCRSKSR